MNESRAMSPRRGELLIRRRRDTEQELALLDAGEHILGEDEYRRLLFDTLKDIEFELGVSCMVRQSPRLRVLNYCDSLSPDGTFRYRKNSAPLAAQNPNMRP